MSLKAGGVALNLTVASHVSLANLLSLPTYYLHSNNFLNLQYTLQGKQHLFF